MQRLSSLFTSIVAALWVSQVMAAPVSERSGQDTARDLPVAGVVTEPDWVQKPTGDDLSKYFPPFAAFIGVSGRVIIDCLVTSVGGLTNCSTLAETPAGFRFGQAALRMTALFRMRPLSVDGNPVSGGTVRIPLVFTMPTPVPFVENGKTPGPELEKAMPAARRVASAMLGPASGMPQVPRWEEYLGKTNGSREELLALKSYQAAFETGRPLMVERLANAFASTYSVRELNDIATFLESPSGRALTARQPDVQKAAAPGMMAANAEISAAARKAMCGEIACIGIDRVAPAPSAEAAK